jgi:hypothetical protein
MTLIVDERTHEEQDNAEAVARRYRPPVPALSSELRGGRVHWLLGHMHWYRDRTDSWDYDFVSLRRTPLFSSVEEGQPVYRAWLLAGCPRVWPARP